MAIRSISLTDALYEYTLDVSFREPDVLRRLREATLAHPHAALTISPEEGQFLHLLAKLVGARRAIELGVFTGYSTAWVAMALPSDGTLVACDVNAQWAAVGQPFWQEAGLDGVIDLRIGPGVETLRGLLATGQASSYDYAFIDADKYNYDSYYELCLELIRPGGLIVIDNVYWGGAVVRPERTDERTALMRALNRKIKDDRRVDISLVPIGDGVTLCRKR